VHADDAKFLESFHMKCQPQILGITWQDDVRNVKVTNLTGLLRVMDQIAVYFSFDISVKVPVIVITFLVLVSVIIFQLLFQFYGFSVTVTVKRNSYKFCIKKRAKYCIQLIAPMIKHHIR